MYLAEEQRDVKTEPLHCEQPPHLLCHHHFKHLTYMIFELVNVSLHTFLHFTPVVHSFAIGTSSVVMSRNICYYYVAVDFIVHEKIK